MNTNQPDQRGRFGAFGGQYAAETLMPALHELEKAYLEAKEDPAFQKEYQRLLREYAGRPSLLYNAERLSAELGFTVLLKREDLNHTGAHKINNVLGQVLLARRMGKRHLIAETGAGQHGVAAATACGAFWPFVRRVHGRGRYRPPVPQCLSDGIARRQSACRDFRHSHAQGRNERSHARVVAPGR